jgi:hypothetical protein
MDILLAVPPKPMEVGLGLYYLGILVRSGVLSACFIHPSGSTISVALRISTLTHMTPVCIV